ncbi:MAG TPA: efflux RND transporter periplasmic adaptor subunit [Chitinophagaceae bacterium]|jgi:HlyD family secretion protein|nr:efflux RND transporter periplasmic adaptor subunit [Chitinophagaceae bacterium]
MNKKLLWIIIGLVAVIVLLVVLKQTGALGKEEGTKVSAEKVSRRTIIETVNASGKLFPEVEVKVSPDISGEIVELKVEEGDSVKKGSILARIYADIYTTQRDQAAALVNQQQATVSNSAAQLEALKATMDQAKRVFDRQKQLLDEKVISRAEFEQAESSFLTAQANYSAAIQGVKGNEAGVSSAQANLQKANKDLSRTAVLAPMNGVISLLNVKKGERVVGNSMMAGTEMMRVADMSLIEVIVDVGENDIPKVHFGDSAIVEIDAYNNRKFKGLVTKIASSNSTAATSSAATTANDVTNYKVHIRLLRESYKDLLGTEKTKNFPFRPGMSASADIQTKRHENALSVPINSVTTREKGSDKAVDNKKNINIQASNKEPVDETKSLSPELDEVVFVLQKDKTVKKVNVRTDIQDISYIEILSGLKEGDEVITGPYGVVSKTLKEGQKVTVVDKDKLFEVKKD